MIEKKIQVRSKNQNYNIVIGNNITKKILKIFKDNSINFDKCLIVVDNKVPKKFIKKINFLLKKKK